MVDKYGREISYLRVSVTDRCNLRCIYCMPADGIPAMQHRECIGFELITETIREGVGLGLTKVRLTGGEPLVRKGIVDLVSMVKKLDGLEHLAMTTNGVFLEETAEKLKNAGLDSLNISLDTLDPDKYRSITRVGDIDRTIRGIDKAASLGFPIKINMVIMDDTRAEELEEMRQFCYNRGVKIQFINHFSITTEKKDGYTFDRPPVCAKCNRIRLLSDGTLRPCLHSDLEVKLDPQHIRESLIKTIEMKPERGSSTTSRSMMEIGG